MILPVQVTKKNIMLALILALMAVVTYMLADVLKNASIMGPPTPLVMSSMMAVMSLHVFILMKSTVTISLTLVTHLV